MLNKHYCLYATVLLHLKATHPDVDDSWSRRLGRQWINSLHQQRSRQLLLDLVFASFHWTVSPVVCRTFVILTLIGIIADHLNLGGSVMLQANGSDELFNCEGEHNDDEKKKKLLCVIVFLIYKIENCETITEVGSWDHQLRSSVGFALWDWSVLQLNPTTDLGS